jgi:hypothetical protein
MRKGAHMKRVIVFIILIGHATWAFQGGRPDQLHGEIMSALRAMDDSNWETRKTGLQALMQITASQQGPVEAAQFPSQLRALFSGAPKDRDRVVTALIALLSRENANAHGGTTSAGQLGEDYFNFYGDVIASVVALNDRRAIPALLGAIETGGMVTRSLASFGDAALPGILQRVNDPDVVVRMGAINALTEMLGKNPALFNSNPMEIEQVKRAFLNAAADNEPGVRMVAVRGLAALKDPSVVPVIQKLAESDPTSLPGQADGGKDLYPVRLAAQRALASISGQTQDPPQPQ